MPTFSIRSAVSVGSLTVKANRSSRPSAQSGDSWAGRAYGKKCPAGDDQLVLLHTFRTRQKTADFRRSDLIRAQMSGAAEFADAWSEAPSRALTHITAREVDVPSERFSSLGPGSHLRPCPRP